MLEIVRECIVMAAVTWLALGTSMARSQETNGTLKFYIVSTEASSGKHFVDDIPNTPKTGFISAEPELVLTGLRNVERNDKGAWEAWTDKDGTHQRPVGPPYKALTIHLQPGDVPAFTNLCAQAHGSRLLVKVGEWALSAPWMVSDVPIKKGRFVIGLSSPDECERAERELKKLIQGSITSHGTE